MLHFCTPLKTSKNIRFSDVFRGYRNVTLGEYGLILEATFGDDPYAELILKICHISLRFYLKLLQNVLQSSDFEQNVSIILSESKALPRKENQFSYLQFETVLTEIVAY